MAKLSHSVIKRPARGFVEKVFTDPANPDLVLPMRLRRLGAMEQLAAADVAKDLAAKYVHGFGDPLKPGYVPPSPLPPVDGQPVYVSESACRIAAMLEYAQVADPEDRYSVEDLFGFMTVDAVIEAMSEAFAEIQDGEVEDPLVAPI